jgi:hypothetical protein
MSEGLRQLRDRLRAAGSIEIDGTQYVWADKSETQAMLARIRRRNLTIAIVGQVLVIAAVFAALWFSGACK